MPNFSVTINLTKANRTVEGALALLKLVPDAETEVVINSTTFCDPVRNNVCQMFTFLNVTQEEVLKIKRRLRSTSSYLYRYNAIKSWN